MPTISQLVCVSMGSDTFLTYNGKADGQTGLRQRGVMQRWCFFLREPITGMVFPRCDLSKKLTSHRSLCLLKWLSVQTQAHRHRNTFAQVSYTEKEGKYPSGSGNRKGKGRRWEVGEGNSHLDLTPSDWRGGQAVLAILNKLLFFFWRQILPCSASYPATWYVDQSGLELTVSKWWDEWCSSPYLVLLNYFSI